MLHCSPLQEILISLALRVYDSRKEAEELAEKAAEQAKVPIQYSFSSISSTVYIVDFGASL